MSEDSSRLVSKSALSFLTGTFLSRISGMLRDMTMAFCFGSNPAIAAFMVAYRFANLIRRLFGEGALSSSFIPHFEALRQDDPEKGAQFFRDLLFSWTVGLSTIILLVECALGCWLKWGDLSEGSSQILILSMLMLPGILFICLFALSSALLQCEKKFFLSGAAPIAFNFIWIIAIWKLRHENPSVAVIGLSAAIVLAFFMQWILTVPSNFRFLKSHLSFRQILQVRLFTPELKSALKPFLLGAIGVGAVQINSALDAVFARFASLEGPAYLWYAIRLQQVPLALFGLALSAALLPPLSRAIKANAWDQFRHLLHFALGRSFSLMMPCTIALFVLGPAIVNLIYGRGDFNAVSTYQTIICLWGYGIGLVPYVFVLILAPFFYAQKDYRTPTLASFLSVILSTGINAFMVFSLHLGAFSIALATSAAAFFNFYFLNYKLSQKTGPCFNIALFRSFSKTSAASLAAGAITVLVGHFLVGDNTLKMLLGQENMLFPRSLWEQLLQFGVLFGIFSLTFISYAWMLKAEDILSLIKRRQVEQ